MRRKILVIEDDPDILEILSIILSGEGYEVIPSLTGDIVANLPVILPDLILLDLNLKGTKKTGAEICTLIKTQTATRKIYVIIVSGEPDVRHIAQSCGADSYIKKPFDIDEISYQVNNYLNN